MGSDLSVAEVKAVMVESFLMLGMAGRKWKESDYFCSIQRAT